MNIPPAALLIIGFLGAVIWHDYGPRMALAAVSGIILFEIIREAITKE